MSRLDELIRELCPDGVEYKKIGDIANCFPGATPKTSRIDYWENGTISWMNSGEVNQGEVTFTEKKITQAGYDATSTKMVPINSIVIALAGQGKTRGTVAITKIPLCTNQSICAIVPTNEIMSRFLLHYLRGQYAKLREISSGDGTRGGLNLKMINAFRVPVPPLPVQQEIVRILDTFTALTAELTAELTARKKQYEYYRDRLLNFDGVEYKKIKDVFVRLKGTPITAAKMKEIAHEDGEIRIFAGGKTIIDAREQDIPHANITHVPAVLVQSRGVIDVVYYDKPFTFKNEMWAYTADTITEVKFLYYILKNNIQHFRDAASGMGSLPQISLKVTEEFEIPIPPLEVQNRIVSILDRFDSLCNDLSSGIPAEIEARKKQYEYYRDRLLTFKEKKG